MSTGEARARPIRPPAAVLQPKASASERSRSHRPCARPAEGQQAVEKRRFGKAGGQRAGDGDGHQRLAARLAQPAALQSEQQEWQEGDGQDRRVGIPGEGSVELEQDGGEQRGPLHEADLAQEQVAREPRENLHGQLDEQHAGVEMQQQAEREEKCRGLHFGGKRQAYARVVVPPWHPKVQPLVSGEPPQRQHGLPGVVIDERLAWKQPRIAMEREV